MGPILHKARFMVADEFEIGAGGKACHFGKLSPGEGGRALLFGVVVQDDNPDIRLLI